MREPLAHVPNLSVPAKAWTWSYDYKVWESEKHDFHLSFLPHDPFPRRLCLSSLSCGSKGFHDCSLSSGGSLLR